MNDNGTDSPFARPDLSEGYPLEKKERDSLREAIRDIENGKPGAPPSGEANGARDGAATDELGTRR